MDFAFALLELVAEFIHVAQETDVFLDEESFAIWVELLEFLNDVVATFFASVDCLRMLKVML